MDALRKLNQARRLMEYGTEMSDARVQEQCMGHLALIDLLVRGQRMEASHAVRQHLSDALARKIRQV